MTNNLDTFRCVYEAGDSCRILCKAFGCPISISYRVETDFIKLAIHLSVAVSPARTQRTRGMEPVACGYDGGWFSVF